MTDVIFEESLKKLQPMGEQKTGVAPAFAEGALPRRMLATIARREAESERLIGWAQLALVTLFGILYALAPKPVDAMMARPVPIALSLYAAFTLVRLALSHADRLPGTLIHLSMIIDVTLLLWLIWAFHIQYEQPAAFSLKVPTFAYLFVLIALRALRFSPRYVISIGLSAAAGWLVLTLVVLHEQGRSTITRSFAAYVSPDRVLVGAEIDKIVAILVVTAVLALAIHRGRRTLLTAVREEASRREIRRFLSPGVAEAIVESEERVEAGRAEERDAAVLMLDLRGFTPFSAELEPREIVSMLVQFHARIGPIVSRHDGVVDKFLGDGVMITFGAVTPSPAAAANALACTTEIMMDAVEWQIALARKGRRPPRVNAALVAGPVVFAALGDAERLEYTVIGEPVNLAAKLEKHNKIERTAALTTAATLRLARAQGFAPSKDPMTLKDRRVAGVPEALDLVVLAR